MCTAVRRATLRSIYDKRGDLNPRSVQLLLDLKLPRRRDLQAASAWLRLCGERSCLLVFLMIGMGEEKLLGEVGR